MLKQERKEEVMEPAHLYALSSQLLLWRQDSAWFRADLERRKPHIHDSPPGGPA